MLSLYDLEITFPTRIHSSSFVSPATTVPHMKDELFSVRLLCVYIWLLPVLSVPWTTEQPHELVVLVHHNLYFSASTTVNHIAESRYIIVTTFRWKNSTPTYIREDHCETSRVSFGSHMRDSDGSRFMPSRAYISKVSEEFINAFCISGTR